MFANSHSFTTDAARFPLHAGPASDIDYDAVWREEQALERRSAAWDAMWETARDFDTDAYERAKARFWRAS